MNVRVILPLFLLAEYMRTETPPLDAASCTMGRVNVKNEGDDK
jgi:hypothetical protein